MAILSEVFEKSICQYISSANYKSITYFSSLQKTRNRRLLPILNNPCKFSSTTFHCCRKSLSSSFCTDGVVTRIRFYPLLPNNNSNFLTPNTKDRTRNVISNSLALDSYFERLTFSKIYDITVLARSDAA